VQFREVALEIGIDAVHVPILSDDADAYYRAGGAAGDFDRDGDTDLFVLGGGGAPDRLFLNRGDGTFLEASQDWGVARRHRGGGVCCGDLDGDGWPDLYVTSLGAPDAPPRPGAHLLYRNTGEGRFVEVAASAGLAFTSAVVADGTTPTLGDYDLDGDLDLVVTGVAITSDGNRLFRNEGNLTFVDVTAQAGVFQRPAWGFCARFADLDGDRHPELLFVADFGTSRYYANRGDGTFLDETSASGTGLDENGMGQALGDFDGDGLLDWYVTSIFSRSTRGNVLYRNLGGHRYEEVGRAAGVQDGNWAWGTVAVDVDQDGHLDLVVVNGWFHDLLPYRFVDAPARLFLNNGDGTFREEAEACGLTHRGQGRGLIDIDLEGDGDRDLVVFTSAGPLAVYRNEGPLPGHALRLVLDTRGAPHLAPDGFGTRVVAQVGERTIVRTFDGGSSYLSQGEATVHLGLGAATRVDVLRIEWPDGQVDTLEGVAADQTLVVRPTR
jgi:hypothetical protein